MPLDRLEALKVERGMLLALLNDARRGRPEVARRLRRITAAILRAELAVRFQSVGASPARGAEETEEDQGQPLKWWQR